MSGPVLEFVPAPALELARARAIALIESLGPQEIEDLAAGRAQLVYRSGDGRTGPRAHHTTRREPDRAALGIDIAGVVNQISACTTAAEVAEYLAGLDARFTVPVLREIARAIGPTVAATGRTKAQLRRDIVEGTAGFRERTAAMSGGAWG
ncbi:MAG: hypothetical protein L0H84_06045 [Pseudonocardia sp.]|nr:hypothetical protein [Pseudonocardia sp.]